MISKWHKRQKESTVTLYYEAVKYLLEMYATDDIIAEADVNMMPFTQLAKRSPMQ